MGEQGIEGIAVSRLDDARETLRGLGELLEMPSVAALLEEEGLDTAITWKDLGGVWTLALDLEVDWRELAEEDEEDEAGEDPEDEAEDDDLTPEQFESFMRSLFGGDIVRMRMAALGNDLLLAMGPEDLLPRVLESAGNTKPPVRMAAAAAAGDGPLCQWMDLDLARLILPILRAEAQARGHADKLAIYRELEASPPLPIHTHVTVTGDGYAGRGTVALRDLLDFMEAIPDDED
jgi:hypothetical protein